MMRKLLAVMVVALLFVGTAYAELQLVEIGGMIEARGRFWSNTFITNNGAPYEFRDQPGWFPFRSLGGLPGWPTNRIYSNFGWDSFNHTQARAEQTTSVNVQADFSDNVSTFIELYAFDIWGGVAADHNEFRSNYLTGADFTPLTTNDVEFKQAYIDIKELFGQPLELKIGRQCMSFDKTFLVADKAGTIQRVAHDGLRLTYKPIDKLTIDAWWTKLAENAGVEEDADVDFYGIRGEYAVNDALNVAAYWMYVRDAREIHDTVNTGTLLSYTREWFEDRFDLDNYEVTNLHTIGTHIYGKYQSFDYDLQAAYQFGNADQVGALFTRQQPFFNTMFGTSPYGDNNADWGAWALDAEVGYTIDMAWSPRVFVGGAYYAGEDNRETSFWEWMNPFTRPEASISFNRLFSNVNYAPVIQDNGELSNFEQIRAGFEVKPTDKISVKLTGQQLWSASTFDWPVHGHFGRLAWPYAPQFPFWTQESSDNLGFEVDLLARYQYSKDLTFTLYYGHLFTGQGMIDGNYTANYGLLYSGGTQKDDADYAFLLATLKF